MQPHTFERKNAVVDHKNIAKFLSKRWAPWALRYSAVITGLLFFMTLFGLAFLKTNYGVDVPWWAVWVAAAVFVIAMVTVRKLWQKKLWSSIGDAPAKQVRYTTTVSIEGLGFSSEHAESLTRWSAFRDAIHSPYGILLLHSPFDYVLLPSDIFDDALQQEEVLERIRDWIPIKHT